MKPSVGIKMIMSLFLLVGCNYIKLKGPQEDVASYKLPSEKLSELSYGLLAMKVFVPKCVYCHGSSDAVKLDSYSDVVSNLSKIQSSVFEQKTMPKRGSLNTEELSYLWNWIQMGAPENARSGNPPPAKEPLLATFESLNQHVFQTSCKDCHNTTGTGKRILLDKESLMNSPLELIIPGNPDESGLVVAIERMDEKRMPPAKEGYSALSTEAKEAIRLWIQNGASD